MVDDLGLEIMAWQPFRDYEALPHALKIKNLDRAERKFDLMEAVGTNILFICSNTSPLTINNIDKAAEDLFDIAERAAQRGFHIGYEALSWGRHVSTYNQSVEIVRRANHPNLGNLLDNFHISVVGSSFEEIYNIPKEKILAVQVADAPRFDMGALHLGRHYRCFPGRQYCSRFLRAIVVFSFHNRLRYRRHFGKFGGGCFRIFQQQKPRFQCRFSSSGLAHRRDFYRLLCCVGDTRIRLAFYVSRGGYYFDVDARQCLYFHARIVGVFGKKTT